MRLIVCGCSRSGTTLLNKVLNEIPSVLVSCESRLYQSPWTIRDPAKLIAALTTQIGSPDPIEPNLDRHKVNRAVGLCDRIAAFDPKRLIGVPTPDRIGMLENALFMDAEHWGDKTYPDTNCFIRMEKYAGPAQKYLYIYRDGRDVVASIYRQTREKNGFGLKVGCGMREISDKWVLHHRRWQKFADSIDVERTTELRFEDFGEKPHLAAGRISVLLPVLFTDVLAAITSLFVAGSSHIGYHDEHVPNWREEFSPEALELLVELGYSARA